VVSYNQAWLIKGDEQGTMLRMGHAVQFLLLLLIEGQG